MLNKEVIRKWADALRSGKYVQCTGSLFNEELGAHCCLGVLCEVAEENGIKIESMDWRRYGVLLPSEVADWAGLHSIDPILGDMPNGERLTATAANDSLQWSFDKIADVIEEKYLGGPNSDTTSTRE